MSGTMASGERFRRAFILLLLAAVLVLFIGMVRGFLAALLLAAIFSALLYPLQEWTCRGFGGRRNLAAAVVLTGAVLLAGIPLLGLLALIAKEAMDVSESASEWVRGQLQSDTPLAARMPEWLPFREQLLAQRETVLEKLGEAVSATGAFLVGSLPDITRGTFRFLLNTFVMLYAMFYFLADGPKLLAAAKDYLPLQKDDRDHIVRRGFGVARAALKSILVVGVLEGVLMALAFLVVGIKGAAFWGLVVVILAALPGVGAPLVWAPAAAWLFMSGSPGWGVAMLVWGVVVIGGVDNILRPIIVGRDSRMPDLLILISTLGGITMFGIAGIVVGPIVAAVVITALGIYRRAFAPALPD